MIKYLITKSAIIHYVYSRFAIVYCKIKVHFATSFLKNDRLEILSRGDLISLVSARKNSKSSSVCHVIGSGWSLNNSKSIINDGDFVVGFNYAGLYDLSYDAYFVEFGGEAVADIARAHRNIVREVVAKSTDIICFKNLWESKNDIEFIRSEWAGNVKYIKDYVIPCAREVSLSSTLERCLDESGDYMPQYTSTALTCIFLMYFSGFKEIVLHGIDFGGQYFYEAEDFDGLSQLAPKFNTDAKFYAATTKKSVHPTASASVGMKAAIPLLAKLLDSRGVRLYSASNVSPISKMLPTYK